VTEVGCPAGTVGEGAACRLAFPTVAQGTHYVLYFEKFEDFKGKAQSLIKKPSQSKLAAHELADWSACSSRRKSRTQAGNAHLVQCCEATDGSCLLCCKGYVQGAEGIKHTPPEEVTVGTL